MTIPPHIKPHYRVLEFEAAFGVGHTKTYELIKSGALRAVKFGTRTLITGESAYLWSQTLPALELKAA